MSKITKRTIIALIAIAVVALVIYLVADSQDQTEYQIADNQSEISFVTCVDHLYSEDRDSYDYWEAQFSALYPELSVYDAGAYCELSNGNQLISFSYFSDSGDINDTGQTIVLFNTDDEMLDATEGFHCQTLGDLGYPIFESLEDDIVTMSCKSGDAGHLLELDYELDLNTLEVSALN